MRAGRFRVSMLAISRSCLAKALVFRSVMSPSEPNTSKSRLNTFVQLAMPVVDQPGRHHHQCAFSSPRLASLAQDEGGFDGLAQPHLVGNQIASR